MIIWLIKQIAMDGDPSQKNAFLNAKKGVYYMQLLLERFAQ